VELVIMVMVMEGNLRLKINGREGGARFWAVRGEAVMVVVAGWLTGLL
jgi:hypothetical protein